jgi:hypothetical protein
LDFALHRRTTATFTFAPYNQGRTSYFLSSRKLGFAERQEMTVSDLDKAIEAAMASTITIGVLIPSDEEEDRFEDESDGEE